MTTMRDWTTDELIDGLWNKNVRSRCSAAYELGRRKDTPSLKAILSLEMLTEANDDEERAASRRIPAPLTQAQRDTYQALLVQNFAAPEDLLSAILENGDSNMRYLAVCAAAGMGKQGLGLLQRASQIKYLMPWKSLLAVLDVCKLEVMELFVEEIYGWLQSVWQVRDFTNLLSRKKPLGIHMLTLSLNSGHNRQRILWELQNCEAWSQHDQLVMAVIDCIYDTDMETVKAAINLAKHAKLANAVPFLAPLLRDNKLSIETHAVLRAIGTPEAMAAVDAWWKGQQLS